MIQKEIASEQATGSMCLVCLHMETACRYARVREAAQHYTITQFGLSCWQTCQAAKQHVADSRDKSSHYVVTTFNAWIFPDSAGGETMFDLPQRRFMVGSGESYLLIRHDCDVICVLPNIHDTTKGLTLCRLSRDIGT
jgi:hypothetical protein